MLHYSRLTTERRTDNRIELAGYVVKFVDIKIDFTPTITDISWEGLRMAGVTRKLAYKETPTQITVSGKLLSGYHKLTIMPCWRKKNALYWDVGFYIPRAPEFWKRFVRVVKMQSMTQRPCN